LEAARKSFTRLIAGGTSFPTRTATVPPAVTIALRKELASQPGEPTSTGRVTAAWPSQPSTLPLPATEPFGDQISATIDRTIVVLPQIASQTSVSLR
jgi:hypothetical protein